MSQENQAAEPQSHSYIQNILAGLTVSFVAISLGAAFGILSGRGAFVGILSAGVIALITALFGGTRIQCSGPTAPMTTVMTAIVLASTTGEMAPQLESLGISTDHFLNIVLIVTGVMLVLMAVLRLGKFITIVPQVVISGFMNGIALLIWLDQVKKLFGLSGASRITGPLEQNVGVALVTVAGLFLLPPLLKKYVPKAATYLPGTLLIILVMTPLILLLGLDIQKVSLTTTLSGWSDVTNLFSNNIPTTWSGAIILLAIPFAFQLTILAYLDTLLTSLVMDNLVQKRFDSDEVTAQNKELAAQGVANGAVALFGGIPGAQATIRSVLILNEGATLRLAGVMVGIFVFIELAVLSDLIALIPQAVFSGILFKVGYDVFDWEPLKAAMNKGDSPKPVPLQWFVIAGTTIITLIFDLNTAVISFCVIFYIMKKFMGAYDLGKEPEPAEA